MNGLAERNRDLREGVNGKGGGEEEGKRGGRGGEGVKGGALRN